ncbi:glutathione S-transferase [Streptomyces sp. e14]|nr:glutathione S-transferase [Streptomyces sp. e14]
MGDAGDGNSAYGHKAFKRPRALRGPDHRRRPGRLAGRGGAVPAGGEPGLPVGEPGARLAAAARPGGRRVAGRRRPDPGRPQLAFHARSGRPGPGARHPVPERGLRPAGGRLPRRGERARDRGRAERGAGHQRLPADHPGLRHRVERAAPAGGAGPVSAGAARRDRRGGGRGVRGRQQRRVPGGLRRGPGGVRGGLRGGVPAAGGAGGAAGRQRYLVGDTITEADIRLFTTLVRFDAVYHGHFKCNRWKLAENPVLWAYVRDLYQTPGFGDTVDFDHIKRHYYQVHTGINPTRIVPLGPDLGGWLTPHHREELGGRPFGEGTPPGPVPHGEEVPASGRP